MPRTLRRSAIALVLAAIPAGYLLGAQERASAARASVGRGPSSGKGRPAPADPALAPPPASLPIYEGPGGRVALRRWTLRTDPRAAGTAHGWQRGGFAGRPVSVPNDVDPVAYS